MDSPISNETLEFLKRTGTCAIANAIETFRVRLRNEGFGELRCRFPELAPMVGYAATIRIRGSSPPMTGESYLDRTDWWQAVENVPPPHIVVIEDMDRKSGTGAFVGEIHAAILKALGCVGVVTNGAVRDLPAVRQMGFNLFSGTVSVSHSYVHVVDFGKPVVVDGLEVGQGDLLHGDQHGLVRIPMSIAEQLPAVVTRLREREEKITAYCRSDTFSVEGLRRLLNREKENKKMA